jgi:UDP-3-O-[3-hydroxymyristoyl] N-acetylglucosamine deacetylase
MVHQRTVAREVTLSGVGVHSGQRVRLVLRPSDSGRILFRRSDLGAAEAPVTLDRVEFRNSTTLVTDRFKVRTVEHALAALFAFGIQSLVLELDAEEMPILDGSARPFVEALEMAGTRDLDRAAIPLRITTPVVVRDGDASVVAEPMEGACGVWLSYTIEYSHPAIRTQSLGLMLNPETFAREIAPARTFGFLLDVESLRRQGLARGASTDNTVVLDEDRIVNPPLRFPDEFVRHKLLDLAGDLALIGRPLSGRFTAFKAGHRLHLKLVQALAARSEDSDRRGLP